MPRIIATIPTDLHSTRLGLPSLLQRTVAGRPALQHTLARLARVKGLAEVVLVHPADQDPTRPFQGLTFSKPVRLFADPQGLTDRHHPMRTAARKWALNAWRGGLGGATCYDELLPASSLFAAMLKHNADAALLVGADWLLIDPDFCQQVIDRHVEHPQAMPMTFTQAPPGLAGIVIARDLMEKLAKTSGATIGQMLSYNPSKPQGDPIGRDVCVQIPGEVRSCAQRFIYDTPATAAMIDWIAARLDARFQHADAAELVALLASLDDETACSFAHLPQMITLELTPRRCATGPITPHHHVHFDRPDMPPDLAERLIGQMGQDADVALTLGGLGDALLHPQWDRIVAAAHHAGVFGIAVETDLLVDQPTLNRLLELPVDVVTVRLNADTAPTYRKVMIENDEQAFSTVIGHLQWLLNERNRRGRQSGSAATEPAHRPTSPGCPWLVPRLIKTADTLTDMEPFFNRWVHFVGHAVIEPATPGCGLMPERSPVCMAPPGRFACRQLAHRMTIHSDGRVPRCDQDWLGRACAGDAATTPLADIWRAMQSVRQAHRLKRWNELELCNTCHEWHRP